MKDYDTWRLQGPDEHHDVGTHDGETCGRYDEPDEDAPRGYKPKPCMGVMSRVVSFDDRHIACDTCGALA